ncbi:MAG: hypothetical protein HY088_08605 [Ignavibacteriales bacterium]|nr:hypothetical protein [Ignavibacteriales bacterium]
MKNVTFHIVLLAAVVLLLQACNVNSPIELKDQRTPDVVEISFLKDKPDTTIIEGLEAKPTRDITGLTQEDEDKYPATILINGGKTDFAGAQNSFSLSRLIIKDRKTPIPFSGTIGKLQIIPHLDVGKAKIDNSEFTKTDLIIQIKSLTLIPVRAGVVYKLANDPAQNTSGFRGISQFEYKPNYQYVIEAEGKDSIRQFSKSIQSPDQITIVNPKPAGLVFSDEDLVVEWHGAVGEVARLMISTYDEKTGHVQKPLMLLTARPTTNSLVISSKVLKLVPKAPNGRYMLSFISTNRYETSIPGYADKVLVQAASIYNLTVSIR